MDEKPVVPAEEGAMTLGGRRIVRPPSAWTVLLAPAVIALAGLIIWPLGRTVYLSFTDTDITGTSVWIGLANYRELWSDARFLNSLRVTSLIVVVGGVLQLVLGMSLALLLAGQVSRLGKTLRVIFAIPMMLSPVVVGVTWRSLLDPHWGWINAITGQQDANWLGDPSRALWVVIAVDVWQWTPYMFMLLTAGLLAVPTDIYEAAATDGAGRIRVFWHMTLPLMAPVILISTLLRTIELAKSFDLPYNLTSGGPGSSTQTLGILIYHEAFASFDQGYASALSVTVMALLVAYVLVYLRGLRLAERRIDS